ncbi:MAG: DUF177 domain-containing protein [Alphaproteobacteria bacterium]|nr:DUF177 domain-containing protein [Alphaproteobacteria bacterium]
MGAEIVPEFSKVLRVDAFNDTAKQLRLEAGELERAALARRFDLLSIDSLTADLTAERIKGGDLVRVRGRLTATIVLACVVTGEPVAQSIDEVVDERFGPPGEAETEVAFSFDEEDPPEPIIDNEIDLGEIVAQNLGVVIDPYPRAPEAKVPCQYQDDGEEPQETSKNPFESLAALKKTGD